MRPPVNSALRVGAELRPLEREDLKELHFIAFIENVPSICQRELLSHASADGVAHRSWETAVQERRRQSQVPDGLPLHAYANLYIHARNPTLYSLLRNHNIAHDQLCVLRISSDVLDITGTIITDMNAARYFCRFHPAPKGLAALDKGLVFAERWTDSDPAEQDRRKAGRSAEVLVPNAVPSRYLLGALVSCLASKERLDRLQTGLTVEVDEHMFFM
jgi:hypothetical protein